jgi:hypothetical protein
MSLCVASAFTGGGLTAQQPVEKLLADYKRLAQTTPNDEQRAAEMRDGKYLLTKPTAADKAVLKAKAEQLVFRITHAEYHTVIGEGSELKPRPNDKTMAVLIKDLENWLLTPTKVPKPNVSQLDYIRELGAALDAAILNVLTDKSPPPLLRIAAMRMLVAAAETGAPAHWNTIHRMLLDPKTPPEILIYAIRAAESLLASYDPNRAAWIGANAFADEKIVVDIVNALDAIVLKGPPILDKVYIAGEGEATLSSDPKKSQPAPGKLTPEQVGVAQLYRYHALKALGRLTTEIVGGKAVEARPAYTFAKVAVGDPAIQPPPNTKEIGEALIGLASIVPGKQIHTDELLYAMATGLRVFAYPKTANPDDNTVAWKGTAARMQQAFKTWNEALQRSSLPPANVKKSAAEFVKKADDEIFAPILKPGLNKPNALALDAWLKANPPANGGELYSDKKGLKLTYPAGR